MFPPRFRIEESVHAAQSRCPETRVPCRPGKDAASADMAVEVRPYAVLGLEQETFLARPGHPAHDDGTA